MTETARVAVGVSRMSTPSLRASPSTISSEVEPLPRSLNANSLVNLAVVGPAPGIV